MSDRKRAERRHVPGLVLPFLVRELMAVLTPTEHMAWSAFFLHSNIDGVSCLRNETVIAECGFSRNTFLSAKRGLIKKKWLEYLGQRAGRGAGIYKVAIPLPQAVERFSDALWDVLDKEPWWDDRLENDKFDPTDNHFSWLVSWRIVRALKDADAAVRNGRVDLPAWNPNEQIPPDVARLAQGTLLDTLRRAGAALGKGEGLWVLWRDGFDAAKGGVGIPKSGIPGVPKLVSLPPQKLAPQGYQKLGGGSIGFEVQP